MKRLTVFLCLTLLLFSCQDKFDKKILPFQDPSLSVNERVNDLIARMTLEEKIGQFNYSAPAIDRLGIPEYNWWNECLHGVGRAGLATVFPQAIGMAASWNTDLMYDIGEVISNEARAKHHEFARNNKRGIYYGLTFWTPNINIFRDPRWGRGQETYGEDPYLTGHLAVPFIKGLQGDDDKYLKVIATAKHYGVHSGPESTRHSVNVEVDEIDLRETYLPAFEATVKDAKVASIMCAYNRVREEACCGSNLLLNKILREEWGFSGYVVSDCGAISDFYRENGHGVTETAAEAAALAFRTGTDLNCGNTSQYLMNAIEERLITEDEIDIPLRRLMEARILLGMFDTPELVPYSSIPYGEVRKKGNLELAKKASRESIVLLKNDGILPLSKSIKKIAVIGPVADDYRVMLGNYHGTSDHIITAYKGIKDKMTALGAEVIHAPGCLVTKGVPILETIDNSFLFTYTKGSQNGLHARYFDNREFEGDAVIERVDAAIDFFWYDRTPVTGNMADEFSVIWEGFLKAPVSGEYEIGMNACNNVRFYFDDSARFSFGHPHAPSQKTISVHLNKDEFYPIKVEYFSYGNDPQAHLLWSVPGEDYEKEAIEIGADADAIIMVMGLSPFLEGEEMPIHVEGFSGGDRTDIKLPATQSDLIQKIKKLGKPSILVLLGGSAVSDIWAAENIDAILHAWYPGEFGGTAIADVLFGDYSPSGKLPVTFYKSVNDIPDFNDYSMKGRTYKYFEGKPLFPFGHGLSYTTFLYDNLTLSAKEVDPENKIFIKVNIRNSGNSKGSDVVQLYIKDLDASVPIPNISLEGFKKIDLQPGEQSTVEFEISPKQFAVVDSDGKYYLEPGDFDIYIGGEQPGFTGIADASTTHTLRTRIVYSGERIEIR